MPSWTSAAQCGKNVKLVSVSTGGSGVRRGETKSETWKSASAAHECGRAQTVKISLPSGGLGEGEQYSDHAGEVPVSAPITSRKVGSPFEPANWRSQLIETEPEKKSTLTWTVIVARP